MNDMSIESERIQSSLKALRSLGQVGPSRPEPKTSTTYGSAEPKWQEQVRAGNIPLAVEDARRMVSLLNPNDPNYDPRLEAYVRGMSQAERGMFERDPLSLYSSASNLTDSMIKYNKLPLIGSPEFKFLVEEEASMQEVRNRPLKAENSSADYNTWRKIAEQKTTAEVVDTIETLERNYRLAVSANNRSLKETLLMLETYVPPKPFEANMQERRLLEGRQALESMATYYDGHLPEKIAGWYRSFDSVNEQQIALFNILCSVGGGLEGYYDALKQAGETLISRARYHASVVDFRAAYTNDDPGVSTVKLEDTEKVYIKDTLASKEIRETQVEMLSQARRLIMFNVDVAQYDVDKPMNEEGLMRINPDTKAGIEAKREILASRIENLRESNKDAEADILQRHVDSLERVENLNLKNHRELMRLVFGNIDKNEWVTWKSPDTGGEVTTPKEILTWYASGDKVDDREKWLSKMMSILIWKQNGKGVSDFLETADEDEVLRIAKEINEKAENIRLNIGDKVMNSNIEFAAAKIALVSWIEQDKGFQTSGPLAWKYNYINEIGGRSLGRVERTYESGGLYKAFDSINLWAYWRRWVSYKAGLKSTTSFFGPASDEWRREVSKHGPDWLPPLNRIDKSPKIKKIHDRFFDDTPEYRLWRARRLTGNNKLTEVELNDLISKGTLKEPKIDDFMKGQLNKMGWTFGSSYEVQIPMYLPKTFHTNIWELMVDKNTKETVWDLYRMGIMPKDVNWNVYNYESLDRMWVSMSMLTRFAKFFVDTYDAERDPQYQAFFKDAGVQSIAEMAKRVFLAFRDLPEGYQQYIVAIVPFMIAQHTASTVGLTSTDLGSPGSKEKVLKQWNFEMSKWIRAAMWTPQVILDDGQLYDGASQDIQSLRNDITLMIMYYKHVFEKVAQAAYKSDKGKLSGFYNDQIGLYKGSLKDEMSSEAGEATFDFGQGRLTEPFDNGENAVAALLFGDRR